jgi:hypothetical protein
MSRKRVADDSVERELLNIIKGPDDEAESFSKIVAAFLRKMTPKMQRNARIRFEQLMAQIDDENE